MSDATQKESAVAQEAKSATEQAQEQAAREQTEKTRLEKLNSTLDKLAVQYRKREVTRTVDSIVIGELAHEYVVDFIGPETAGGARRVRRSEAIKRLHNELGRYTTDRIDVNREILVFQVALLFGRDTAETLPISVLKGFAPLVARDAATETYNIVPQCVEKAKGLWRRVLDSKVTIAELRDKVARILNPDKPESNKAEGKKAESSKAESNPAETKPETDTQGKLFPGSAAMEARKAMSQSANKLESYKMLGQVIAALELTALVNGLAESIAQDKQRIAVLQALAVAVKSAIEKGKPEASKMAA